jgi:hypothetical protein
MLLVSLLKTNKDLEKVCYLLCVDGEKLDDFYRHASTAGQWLASW